MKTREEKFEAERQKMLSQMGIENEVIEVEEEVEVENGNEEIEFPKSDTSYHEPQDNWTDEQKTVFASGKQAVMDAFEENMELLDSDPKEFDRRGKEREDAARNFKEKGPIKLGTMQNTIDSLGGSIMWVPSLFVALPLGLICWKDSNFISGLVIFAFVWCIIRVQLFAVSLTILPWVQSEELAGKSIRYLVDIKGSAPFGIMTLIMEVLANHALTIIVTTSILINFILSIGFYGDPISLLYKDGFISALFFLSISGFMGTCIWFATYNIFWVFYHGISQSVLKKPNSGIQYRLRYLYSPDRTIISMHKNTKGFPTNRDILKALSRDYNGAV